MSHAIKTSLALGQDLQSRILTTATNPANWEVTTWWGSNRPFHGIGIGDYSFVDVDPEIAPTDQDWIYHKYQSRPDLFGGPGEFYMTKLPVNLETELLQLLPPKLLQHVKEPYIRVQVSKNYQLAPHSDARRSAILISCITDQPADTVFYSVDTPHEFFQQRLPDPDTIHETERYTFMPGEVWLMDTMGVHGTVGRPPLRVTVNYGWYNLTIQDIVPYLE
jgi:hypothetical protein